MEVIGPCDFKEGYNCNQLTLGDSVNIAGNLIVLPGLLVGWSIEYALSNQPKLGYGPCLFNKISGHVTKGLSIRQLRYFVPIKPCRKLMKPYARIARNAGLRNFNHYFGGETYSARWVHETPNRTPDDPVFIYLHGGGYALKLAPPQIDFIIWFAKTYANRRISVLLLDYTVTPMARYPDQLKELCALYTDLAKTCNNINAIGDSCGCHLALHLLVHSVDPVKGVEPTNAEFKSLVFYSPWTGLDVSAGGSYIKNNTKDIIDIRASREMQVMYCDQDVLKNPRVNFILEKSSAFWEKIVPEKTVVVYGSNEILKDGITGWCKSANIKHTFEEAGGVHDATLVGPNTKSTEFVNCMMNQWFPKRATLKKA